MDDTQPDELNLYLADAIRNAPSSRKCPAHDCRQTPNSYLGFCPEHQRRIDEWLGPDPYSQSQPAKQETA